MTIMLRVSENYPPQFFTTYIYTTYPARGVCFFVIHHARGCVQLCTLYTKGVKKFTYLMQLYEIHNYY